MKKLLAIILLAIIGVNLHAQTNIDADIQGLIALDQYDTIIKKYANTDTDDLSAESAYNIGFAYYMLENNDKCFEYMDLVIKKDSINPAAYFIKGSTYNYMEKFDEAIPYLQKAVSLETEDSKLAHSYIYLGYAYYSLNKFEPALEAYHKVIEYEKDVSTPYVMIAQIYSEMDQKSKALEYYYKGKENISKESSHYTLILFNIGLYEQRQGNQDKAESAYKELIELDPTDYHAYAKLIQVYYHNKEYDKAIPLKETLYSAHKDGLIEDENLSDMFCIDQFMWNDKLIKVFERYEEGDKKDIYNKIIFYIPDESGNTSFSIQTEYSPAAVAFGEAKYILCGWEERAHVNYGIGFDDDSKYEDIKKTVISILNKRQERKAAATTLAPEEIDF